MKNKQEREWSKLWKQILELWPQATEYQYTPVDDS